MLPLLNAPTTDYAFFAVVTVFSTANYALITAARRRLVRVVAGRPRIAQSRAVETYQPAPAVETYQPAPAVETYQPAPTRSAASAADNRRIAA